MQEKAFCYTDERFADIQMLRYQLKGFDSLSLQQKKLVYYLSEATLWGRDITFDQFGRYNLAIRKTLEVVSVECDGIGSPEESLALKTYLKRVWFSNGIHHHYGCEKFVPGFSEDYFRRAVKQCDPRNLPLRQGQTVEELLDELVPVIFDPGVMPKRVNKADGADIVLSSACNYYQDVSQKEAEEFYHKMKEQPSDDGRQPSYGLNSQLVKTGGELRENVWKADGMYGPAIRHIIYWLRKAMEVAENDRQREVIRLLVKYYTTGDLRDFDDYSIAWVGETEGIVDFINGFIEVYGDPLGLKGSWEGIVEYRDTEATRRTRTISDNAQWFEDHSPVDERFRKKTVKGVVANVICAAMLGGDEYPSTAIGINLPNADWIRACYGSKSVTIGNLTEAYNKAARGNGFREEFVIDSDTVAMIDKYGDDCDDLHTDLHECLGHGSGQLLPGVDPDALKNYGNTIEEARADLFGLYYIADDKLVELGLLPDNEAYKSQYYTYILNGLMTQLTRITPGNNIEEAHMRNRALIAHWCYENGDDVIEMVKREGKTYVRINDYEALRTLFARLLAEIQRIKSEGDFEAARDIVEKYAVNVDPELHKEILERYRRLDLAPYKGFINPVLTPQTDSDGNITDITVDYTESYEHQMRRYSSDYSTFMQHSTEDKLREIKQSFRLLMNGVVSQSMRQKGVDYKINWGVQIADLQKMAERYGKDYHLAVALWKEDIRECKILAAMVMPAEEMPEEVAEIWMEQTHTQEIAELAAFHLYQYLPCAPSLAFRWIASDDDIRQICGYNILSRLYGNGQEPNERGINEFMDQAVTALSAGSVQLKKAALNAVRRFAGLGLMYQRMAKNALRRLDMDGLL